jgi:hypothetical protein
MHAEVYRRTWDDYVDKAISASTNAIHLGRLRARAAHQLALKFDTCSFVYHYATSKFPAAPEDQEVGLKDARKFPSIIILESQRPTQALGISARVTHPSRYLD